MKWYFAILFFFSFSVSAQNIKVVKFGELETMLHDESHDIQVINFWATWCAPCVKELPFFESLNAKKLPGVNVVLVNLDFADRIERVKTFLNRKKMQARVVLLDEIDGNSWIDKVDKQWSGAIPATLVINTRTGKRKFVEKELREGELEALIDEIQKG